MSPKGSAAPETIEATERAAALAEKSGNLTQLVNLVIVERYHRLRVGRLTRRRLACRPGSRACPSRRQSQQSRERASSPTVTRYWSGDLAGAEKHFTAGLKFFDDPGFKRSAGVSHCRCLLHSQVGTHGR